MFFHCFGGNLPKKNFFRGFISEEYKEFGEKKKEEEKSLISSFLTRNKIIERFFLLLKSGYQWRIKDKGEVLKFVLKLSELSYNFLSYEIF